jgi:indole-3-glycerol phosphate synthase
MFLEQIVAYKKEEVERRKNETPERDIERQAVEQAPPLDFLHSLSGEGIRFICELKKASPSKGIICPGFDPAGTARSYQKGGAAAISVLTEEHYFKGSLAHIREVKEATDGLLPVLCKDFILDRYQVYEARAYGADAILLIAAVLRQEKLRELLLRSHALGMKCFVEAHDADEVGAGVDCGARVIGINNRDLMNFDVDLSVTERLRPLIPEGRLVVAESGIKTRADVLRMQAAGVNAVLVGETLMTAPDPTARLRELNGKD